MPTVIWYLVGIVLSLIILLILGWIVLFIITYPKRKANFEKMSREFEETRARISAEIEADRKGMLG